MDRIHNPEVFLLSIVTARGGPCGTLVIDLFDRKAERTVFRGTVTEVLQRAFSADLAADAKLVSKPINKGIAKIFKKYPAKPK